MQNISAAKEICNRIGIPDAGFYEAIVSFKGASRRQQCLYSDSNFTLILDFAHAPSKVRATTDAVRQLYPDRKLVACLELHTFSSLSREFIPEYSGSLDQADNSIVFFSPKTLKSKGLPPLDKSRVIESFQNPQIEVFTSRQELESFLSGLDRNNTVLLLMSSGNFEGMDLEKLINELLGQ
jgi:UDP-N-acetylmuramate: L-alanyl-gamma-D-glutamyl-meso-diaminopimelate ligase